MYRPPTNILFAVAVAFTSLLTHPPSRPFLVHAQDASTDNTTDDATTPASDSNKPQCGYYLAVSSTSTPEEPRWGVYTAHPRNEGDPILFGDVAINIPNLIGHQLRTHHPTQQSIRRQGYLEQVVDFLEQFVWVPNTVGGQFELAPEDGRAVTAIPGTGVLASFHHKLTNADWDHLAAYHRPKWNEPAGIAHPGRGAYSGFYGATMEATSNIKAGMEIFVNYGDNWDDDDDDDSDSDENNKLTHEDHEKIDKTIEKIISFYDKHEAELDEASKADIFHFLMVDVMSAAAGAGKGKLIRELLPSSIEELRRVPETGGSLPWSQPAALRPLDWLTQYGLCMDAIRPGPSTIPHAGRGAFATRPIPEGGLVAPVPLVHIVDEDILDMFPLVKAEGTEEDEWVRASNDPIDYQLAINYCYGHPESSMLFLPVGSVAALVNHSRDRPNAKLVWSKHPNHHQHWFNLQPHKLIQEGNTHIGLMMEIVALRPIEEGEEVFIDYGEQWQDAWDGHVQSWKEMQESGEIPSRWPVRAMDIMDEYRDGAKPFAIPEEGQDYPDNIMQKCFLVVRKPTNEPSTNSAGHKVRVWVDGTSTTTAYDSDNLFSCTVHARKQSDEHVYLYDVIFRSQDDPTSVTLVRDVPHKAIVFVDKPGTGDQFYPHAFRHAIGIPDEIFPQGVWRDVIHGNPMDEDYEEDDDDEDEEDNDDEDDDDDDEEDSWEEEL